MAIFCRYRLQLSTNTVRFLVASLGLKGFDLVKDKVQPFDLADDLRLNVATQRSAIACLQQVELLASSTTP